MNISRLVQMQQTSTAIMQLTFWKQKKKNKKKKKQQKNQKKNKKQKQKKNKQSADLLV